MLKALVVKTFGDSRARPKVLATFATVESVFARVAVLSTARMIDPGKSMIRLDEEVPFNSFNADPWPTQTLTPQ